MATVIATQPRTRTPEQRVVLCGISWEGYETILKLVGDQPTARLTYDRGDLELMAPSLDHEESGSLLGRMVETVTEVLHIQCRAAGSTTWRKKAKERGLEADECYYIAAFPQVRGKRKTIDLSVDPPPDLAIEIEISRSALDRMGIYAALGVLEVWRFDGEALHIHEFRGDGTYAEVDISSSFPFLRPEEIIHWLQQAESIEDHSEWGRQFREWVRAELAPRLEEQG
ncbi:MAG: Uma2 family endonuclease [Isosphaerales bacterium]